jgi:hypothetical protein
MIALARDSVSIAIANRLPDHGDVSPSTKG